MQLLNPAMDDEEVKTAGLSKYAFIRTYVQVCSIVSNWYFNSVLRMAGSSSLDDWARERHLVIINLKHTTYVKLFPHGDPAPFAEYIFDYVDVDCSGIITFEEFLKTISITCRGSLEEKLNCEWN